MKKVFIKLSVTFSVLLALAFSQSFAQKVFVPDDAFEQFLIGKGYDNVLDDSVLVSNINTIKSLEIFANNIQSLKGIEKFAALEDFRCTNNNITTFEIGNGELPNLKTLVLNNNRLNSLQIANPSQITSLSINRNLFSTIDLSNFTALTYLDVSNNLLKALSLQQNTVLTSINVSSNALENTFSVETLTSLKNVNCASNKLTAVKIPVNVETLNCAGNNISVFVNDIFGGTGEPLLKDLNISSNQLETLIVGVGITKNLTTLNASNNKLLTCSIDEGLYNKINLFEFRNNALLYCFATPNTFMLKNLISLDKILSDLGASVSTNCERTYMPDDAFEQFMLDAGIDLDGKLNDYVFNIDLEQFTTLDIPKNKIKDLTGVKGMINLKNIYFNSDTTLKSIDVSGMKNLEVISINTTKLESLNVDSVSKLKSLYCYDCKLSTFSLNGVDSITFVDLAVNNLKSIEIPKLIKLNTLKLKNNKLESLDLSNLGSNTTVTCNENPNLFCITVADSLAAAANFANSIWLKDQQASFGTQCKPEVYIEIKDSNFEKALIAANYDNELDGRIRLKNAEKIYVLDLSNLDITDVSGIEYFSNLIYLYLSNNKISTINLNGKYMVKGPGIEEDLYIPAGLFNLNTLNLSNNLIENLDLTGLNNLNSGSLNVTNNSKLSCIAVDDEDLANSNANWLKDPSATYSKNCVVLSVDASNNAYNNSVKVYPNPANDYAVISLEDAISGTVSIFNLNGNVVQKEIINGKSITISTTNLASGVYVVNIISNKGLIVKKLVKN